MTDVSSDLGPVNGNVLQVERESGRGGLYPLIAEQPAASQNQTAFRLLFCSLEDVFMNIIQQEI